MKLFSSCLLLSIFFYCTSCKIPDLKPVKSPLLNFERMEDGYKICVIGDGGTGDENQYRVAQALSQENCDQVRYTGDVIYESGLKNPDDPQFMSKFYKPYQQMLEQGIPFFLMMGNHDFKGEPKAWIEIAKRYDNIYFQNFWYAEKWDDVCFLTIEPSLYAIFGQERWIKSIKKQTPDCKLTISGSHYPYKSVGKHGDANFIHKRFLKKHVLGKTDVYLAGHDHNLSDEGVYNNTRLLVSGAAGKLRPLARQPDPGNFAISAYGWINLIIKRDGEKVWAEYEFRVIPEEGEINIETIREGIIRARGWRDNNSSQKQRSNNRRNRSGPRGRRT